MTGIIFRIDGHEYPLDDFELGELEWLEDELLTPLDELNPSSMKAAVRILYLVKRRDNPNYTLEDARKTKVTIFRGPDDESGGQAAEQRPTPRRARTKRAG